MGGFAAHGIGSAHLVENLPSHQKSLMHNSADDDYLGKFSFAII